MTKATTGPAGKATLSPMLALGVLERDLDVSSNEFRAR